MTTTATGDPGTTVEPRMGNPMFAVADAFASAAGLGKAIAGAGLDARWGDLINIRASQLNRCGVCLVQHQREARARGMAEDQVFSIGGWQDAPWFTPAERVVLALTEAVTVLGGGTDAVDDVLWGQVAEHLDERQIAAVLLQIALVNMWNRLNRATRQVAGQAW